MKPKKLKRVVIREEFVALLDNTYQAVVLGQMLYWQDRVKDVDQYIAEEKNRMLVNGTTGYFPVTHGWIYKTAKELAEEVLLGVNENTIRNHMKVLVEKGYVDQRRNPNYKWDKTYQYRVNLFKLMTDLEHLGYSLEGYELLKRTEKQERSNHTKDSIDLNSCESSNTECGAIPEITSKITSNNTTKTSSTFQKSDEDDDELGCEVNQNFKIISEAYLKLANKTTLSVSDNTAIVDVVNQGWSTDRVISWIRECYEKFQPKHARDQIRSFQYVANYIFDQAASSGEILGGTLNDEDERLISKFAGNHSKTNHRGAEDEYFKRYRTDVSAENPECDF